MRIKFIGPSRMRRDIYFRLRDQLIVVVGVVAFPPVHKPICSAMDCSSRSLCLRMSRLSFERSDCSLRRAEIFWSNSCRRCELDRIDLFKSLSWDWREVRCKWDLNRGASISASVRINRIAKEAKTGLELRYFVNEDTEIFMSISG